MSLCVVLAGVSRSVRCLFLLQLGIGDAVASFGMMRRMLRLDLGAIL